MALHSASCLARVLLSQPPTILPISSTWRAACPALSRTVSGGSIAGASGRWSQDTPQKLKVSGIDKEAVGEVAAKIRRLREPDPYKAKGVKYAGEYIRRKAGKAGKVGAAKA